MRQIFCFIDVQEHMEGQLQTFLESLDADGDIIQLFTDLDDSINDPQNILSVIDQAIIGEKGDLSLVFVTNMKELLWIIYRLYHQIFESFVYFEQAGVREYKLYGIFEKITSLPVSNSEGLFKQVYTNASNVMTAVNYEYKISDLTGLSLNNMQDEMPLGLVRKYYLIDDVIYLFEPVLTKEKTVICISGSTVDHADFIYPGFGNMQYMYDYEAQLLNGLFGCIDKLSGDNILQAYQLLELLDKKLSRASRIYFDMNCCILDDAAQLDVMAGVLRSTVLLSFLMQLTDLPHYLNELLKISIENIYFNSANRLFIWNQCKRYLLEKRVTTNELTSDLMKELYLTSLRGYEKELNGKLTPIPLKERDSNTILIFTNQFLSEGHAPTRTTLERCYTLGKLLGKRIVLFNTREQYTRAGAIIMYKPSFGKVMEEYNEASEYHYKDYGIPFYQPAVNMPDISEIEQILVAVRRLKPSFIFSIASGSIVADLCGKLVPQAAMALAFSTLPTTTATFSIIGRKLSDKEWIQLIREGYCRDSIIETTFTFELTTKKGKLTRKELNIPIDRFVLVTVGIRLDSEITKDFIESIQNTFALGTHIVFAGEFSRYEEFCMRYSNFKEHSTFIGYCNDILALMEICDLYVNPRRLGGGFSIIEAFHEGKPGVTIRYGDIATAAGDEFSVDNYTEMEAQIKRYIEDKDFYREMSVKAREREKVMTDSVTAIKQIIDSIQNNRLFH